MEVLWAPDSSNPINRPACSLSSVSVPPKEEGQPGRTSGFWRPTHLGIAFVAARVRVPSHALVFNRTVIGWQGRVDWSIQEALGKDFDYETMVSESGTLEPCDFSLLADPPEKR